MAKTTGEELSVDWSNIVATCEAWIAHPRYAGGSFWRTVTNHSGRVVAGSTEDGAELVDVTASVNTIPAAWRDDFCERVRYWYGGCINLEQSRAVNPKKLT